MEQPLIPLLQQYASHPGPWSFYGDYPGDSHMAVHHVNGESQSYQQYAHFHQQTYVIAQNDVSQHPPLATPGSASTSYWPTAQVPSTTADPSLSMALSMEPSYYPTSCYDKQDLSSIRCHTARDDHILHGLPSACGGVTYSTTNPIYTESDTPATAPPPTIRSIRHPTIAHQTESGHEPHDLLQWDQTMVGSALYEGGAATAFQTTGTSYTPAVGPYEANYPSATPLQPHYTPEPAKAERRKIYIAAPAPDGQNQYVAPVPVSALAPAMRSTKREVQSPDLPPRGKSPMGHLPYPEDVGIKAEGRCRDSSLHRAITQLPSPAPTRTRSPTPTHLNPYLQTLTFITYPETEPRGRRGERSGGGGMGGNGGADSDELAEDDEEGPSPPRRGRRGKKESKKDSFLACFFCRGRKIACHPRNEEGDRTCTQCAKRHFRCQYPLTSRRGQRKPREPAVGGCDGAPLWGSSASCSPTPPSTRTNSKPRARARASSRPTTSSSLVRAA